MEQNNQREEIESEDGWELTAAEEVLSRRHESESELLSFWSGLSDRKLKMINR